MTAITKADIERLRKRIERIEGGRMTPAPAPPARADDDPEDPFGPFTPPEKYDAEKCLDGVVMENPHGSYFLSERFYPQHKLHGSYEMSRLADMAGEWLPAISRGEIPAHNPERWVFLDTETTGLAGGTGTCAFLIGAGTIDREGFRVRLFFMRDYDEEAAMLYGLAEFLAGYDVLVTYNGKTYDAPLIETRYRLRRQRYPLERLHHLDLLHGARSLWKLRIASCRLVHLEYEILGVERHGDLPGELIPHYYFEYLRTRQAFRLAPLFHHNVIDIVSLACLSGVVLPAYADPCSAALHHGADLLGLARWLRRAGDVENAAALYRRSVAAGMMDNEMFAALWETALLEKKRERHEEKAAILEDLIACRNPYRGKAFEELAKHCERVEKNLERALELTAKAITMEPSEALEKRRLRLEGRLAKAGKAPKKRTF